MTDHRDLGLIQRKHAMNSAAGVRNHPVSYTVTTDGPIW